MKRLGRYPSDPIYRKSTGGLQTHSFEPLDHEDDLGEEIHDAHLPTQKWSELGIILESLGKNHGFLQKSIAKQVGVDLKTAKQEEWRMKDAEDLFTLLQKHSHYLQKLVKVDGLRRGNGRHFPARPEVMKRFYQELNKAGSPQKVPFMSELMQEEVIKGLDVYDRILIRLHAYLKARVLLVGLSMTNFQEVNDSEMEVLMVSLAHAPGGKVSREFRRLVEAGEIFSHEFNNVLDSYVQSKRHSKVGNALKEMAARIREGLKDLIRHIYIDVDIIIEDLERFQKHANPQRNALLHGSAMAWWTEG